MNDYDTMKSPVSPARKKIAIFAAIIVIVAGFLAWLLREPNDGLVSVLATVRISKVLINPLTGVKVDKTTDVNEEMLGAHVTGTCKTTGTVTIELKPDETKAAFNLILTGVSVSNTVGVSGPAQITSRATTQFTAVKEITFDGDSFETTPAKVDPHTDLQIESVDSTEPGLRGRIVQRVAERRVSEEYEESRRLAARQVVNQVSQEFDAAVQKHLDNLNKQLRLKRLLGGQLKNHEQLPMRFRTTENSLHVSFLAAQGEPRRLPDFKLEPSSSVRVGLNLIALAKNPLKTIAAIKLIYDSRSENPLGEPKKGEAAEGETLLAAGGDTIKAVNIGTEEGWIVIHIDENDDGKAD